MSNTFFLFSDWFSLSVLAFLFWFIAGKTLLPEEYGVVSVSVNTTILLSVFSLLGLHTTVQKLIPEYLGKKQKGKVGGLIKFSLKTILLTNLLLMTILLIFSPYFASLLKTTTQIIWIITISIILHSFTIQFGFILYGFQKMKKVFITNFYGSAAKVIASVILIFLGFSYFGPILGFSLNLLIISVLRLRSIVSSMNSGTIDQRHVMIDYALPAFIVNISMAILAYAQYTILTVLQNPEITGIFTIAMVLTSPITIIPITMTTALFPITSRLSVENNAKKRQRYLIQLVFRYALFIIIPLSMLLVIFSKQLILLFSKLEYLPASQLFPILALAGLIYGCGMILYQNIYALGKPKTNRNIAIVTTLIFLTLAMILTPLYSAFGMAMAYLLGVTILSILSFVYIRKYIGFTLPLTSLVKIIIASLISMGLFYLIVLYIQSIVVEIVLLSVVGLVYLTILLLLRFYTKEDIKIIKSVAAKLPFVKKPLLKLSKILSKFI